MRPKIVLHIGGAKTGTSAIQSTFARNSDALKAHGVLYPEHQSFHSARSGQPTSGNIDIKETWFEDQVIRAVSDNPGYANYIFSSEYMCWRMNGFLENYSKYCSNYDFEVIYAVRNPFEVLNASYHQAVKRAGFFLNIEDFALQELGFGTGARVVIDLESRNIPYKLFNYSAIRGDIVKRLFTHLGYWEVVEHDAAKVGVVNRSMTVAELNFLRYVNQIFGHYFAARISDELVMRLPDIAGDILPIDEKTQRKICEANEWAVPYFNKRLSSSEQLTLEPLQPSDGRDVLSPEQIEVIKDVFRNQPFGRQQS